MTVSAAAYPVDFAHAGWQTDAAAAALGSSPDVELDLLARTPRIYFLDGALEGLASVPALGGGVAIQPCVRRWYRKDSE